MNSGFHSSLLLLNRPALSRGLLLFILFECIGLSVLAAAQMARLQNPLIGLGLFAFAYFLSFKNYADNVVSSAVSICLVLVSSLIINSLMNHGTAALTGHYLLLLSLGLIALYRNRRLMALATIITLIEQFLRGMILKQHLFPANFQFADTVMIEHICWLAFSGGILIAFCEAGVAPISSTEDSELKSLTTVAKEEKPVEKPLASPDPLRTSLANAPPASAAKPATSSGSYSPVSPPKASKSGSNPAIGKTPDDSMPSTASAVGDGGESSSLAELLKVAAEVGARAQKLNRTITNIEGPLKRMVQSINGANRGMQEIKDELSRTAASVIQISQGSEMHASKARDVFQAADEAAYGSEIGALSTEQSIRNMERIREQMDSIATRMDNLLSKSQMMVQVVGFADELALQSKVLSVNAAIEAAKAGDRGEGFSAVAREVKSLANQSKDATRQVRQILKEIQKSIAEVRRSIAMGNETVELASDQCRSTAESIKGLDTSVGSSRDAAEAIMNSSKDQVAGIMQISHAMNDIQSVTEQNSGSLSNLQTEAQKLNTITRDLVADMKGYQTLIDQLLSQCAAMKNSESGG